MIRRSLFLVVFLLLFLGGCQFNPLENGSDGALSIDTPVSQSEYKGVAYDSYVIPYKVAFNLTLESRVVNGIKQARVYGTIKANAIPIEYVKIHCWSCPGVPGLYFSVAAWYSSHFWHDTGWVNVDPSINKVEVEVDFMALDPRYGLYEYNARRNLKASVTF